jgi:hypothetical protein
MTVTFDQMKDKLLTLDEARGQLATTEPLEELPFRTEDKVAFSVAPGWHDGEDASVGNYDPVDAHLELPSGQQFQLSKLALLEAGAHVGIPRHKQLEWPAEILENLLNWWFRTSSSRDYKVLAKTGDELALAVCRGTITPFSNLTLLDIMRERIERKYGASAEIMVDYKFSHSLEWTTMRLIVPSHSRVITGSREENDEWCAGIDLSNSQVGIHPSILQGYAFRWWCTNGETTDLAQTPKFSRKGSYDLTDVWAWARESVDEILGGLDGVLDNVQQLTSVPVSGSNDSVTAILHDLFARFNIPVRERQRIIAGMADLGGDLTMYDIMQEITRAANMDGLAPRAVAQLLALGGHVAEAGTARCTDDDPCHRLLPEGWEPRSRGPQNAEQN